MEKEYWQQFIATGKVEDYLNYKMESSSEAVSGRMTGDEKERSIGVNERESDCTDGNGTVYGSGWRV